MDIGIVSGDLMLVSRLLPALKAAGHRVAAGPDRRHLDVAIIDIGPTAYPDWATRLKALKRDGTRVIAFGPHGDPAALARAKGLGADLVTVNGNILKGPEALLRTLDELSRSKGDADDTSEGPDD